MNKLVQEIGDVPRAIYRRLKEDILSGALPPGAQVKIQEIATETGASAVPVREAIRMLASEGLMELRPNRSPIVAPLDMSEIDEITNIRLALEPFVLRLAIPRHTAETLKVCHDLLLQDKESLSFHEKVELNRKFHMALLASAKQHRAMRVISDQYENVARFGQMLAMRGVSELRGHIHHEHLDILREVETGDPEAAVRMLTEHIQSAAARINKAIARVLSDHE